MMSTRHTAVAAAITLAALMASPAAIAKDGDVRVSGTCSGASSVKLKLSEEDGRIEVELEVDQNRNGVTWKVALRRNGAAFFRGSAVTRAPSGSFEVRKLASNSPGSDRFSARATSPRGEICTVSASF
jgi:2-methylaconitate cis-trans-isomerase PrpF